MPVDPLARTTASAEPLRGDESQPTLMANPYPAGSDEASQYENGYEYAQHVGAETLRAAAANPATVPGLVSGSQAWQAGFQDAAGAAGVKVAADEQDQSRFDTGQFIGGLGLAGIGALVAGAGSGIRRVTNAAQLSPDALRGIDEFKSIQAGKYTDLGGLKQYTETGHKLLTAPALPGATGFDVLSKFRGSPVSSALGVGPYDSAAQSHYADFKDSPDTAYRHMWAVNPHGQTRIPALRAGQYKAYAAFRAENPDVDYATGVARLKRLEPKYVAEEAGISHEAASSILDSLDAANPDGHARLISHWDTGNTDTKAHDDYVAPLYHPVPEIPSAVTRASTDPILQHAALLNATPSGRLATAHLGAIVRGNAAQYGNYMAPAATAHHVVQHLRSGGRAAQLGGGLALLGGGMLAASAFGRDQKDAKTAAKTTDRLAGGLADHIPASEFDRRSLRAGATVEREHTKDPALATEIAKDHLAEDPKYYAKLKRMEKAAAMPILPIVSAIASVASTVGSMKGPKSPAAPEAPKAPVAPAP